MSQDTTTVAEYEVTLKVVVAYDLSDFDGGTQEEIQSDIARVTSLDDDDVLNIVADTWERTSSLIDSAKTSVTRTMATKVR